MTTREDRVVSELLAAYRAGAFPMADPASGRVLWFSPDPRAVLELDGLVMSRSLRAVVRRRKFAVTCDAAFESVIRACADESVRRSAPSGAPGGEEHHDQHATEDAGGWIDERIIAAYTLLHRRGHAHSVEAWIGDARKPGEVRLVGGLYGVHIGGAFFGESMFCRVDEGGTDASKACLVHLVHHLRRRGFVLLDSQIANDHMVRMGVHEIRRRAYLQRLREAVELPLTWGAWDEAATVAEVGRTER